MNFTVIEQTHSLSQIEDEFKLRDINDTNGQWLTYKAPVTKGTTDDRYVQNNSALGIHVLTWIYTKDYSISQGEDAVLIRVCIYNTCMNGYFRFFELRL